MVIVPIPFYAEFGPNDHQEDAPYFVCHILYETKTKAGGTKLKVLIFQYQLIFGIRMNLRIQIIEQKKP